MRAVGLADITGFHPHHGVMPLSPNALSNLVAIRAQRNIAASQAKSPGAAHRQVAVILLDAAIERTAFTAAEFLEVTFAERDGVDKALQELRALGWKPGLGLETDRRRLHRVRNIVQHVGTGVNRDELPQWVIATEQIIASIVRFAYEMDLDDVRYSYALEDTRLREFFDLAEANLAAGDEAASIEATVRAFDLVSAVWSRFARSTNRDLEPRHGSYAEGIGTVGGDDPKVVALQEISLLTAIAPEPGEAIWFLEAHKNRSLLNLEEAQRALAFVFDLAIAVEASPAARRDDRRHRYFLEQRHERSSPELHATIGDYSLEHWGEQITLTFTIHGVPTEADYSDWAQAVSVELNRSSHRRLFHMDDRGKLTYQLADGTDDFADALSRIETALRDADSAVETQRKEAEAAETKRRLSEKEYKVRVDAAVPTDLPPWVSFDVTTVDIGGCFPTVVVQLDEQKLGSPDSRAVQQVFVDAGAWAYSTMDGWVARELTPEGIPVFAGKLVAGISQLEADARDAGRAAEEALAPVIVEMSRRGYYRSHD